MSVVSASNVKRLVAGFALAAITSPALAGNLIYTPTNPAFGGSPGNAAFLLNQASAQNQHLPSPTTGPGGGSSSLTPGQIFAQQLQSQLLSSFANQITQAIFGPNAQTAGTFSFGATTIQFARVGNDINITINDGQTITNIVVPAAP
ncbi:MAG TPA: curli assembly protein CsgF [Xanthobacteraceae bacterium]|nr:curli assembly protein CsgF [Xanthobacteraceae bacterium]